MKLSLAAILVVPALFASPVSKLAGIIPDQYIVVFKDEVTFAGMNEHFEWLEKLMKPLLPKSSFFSIAQDSRKTELFAQSETSYWDFFGLIHKYHLPDFKGYSIRIPSFVVKLLERHSDILFIEKDQVMSIHGTQKNPPSWGLSRISSRELPGASSKTYSFPDSSGTGVDAYVIDTGVFVDHPEFEGRARVGKSFSNDGTRDGNGHGTHCAGTIGSKTYGVAKNVSIIAVKVLDNQGSGSTSNVIAGIDWAAKDATNQAKKKGKMKAVANMSLGGGASTALDRAVTAATKAGLVFGVAAGNSGRDACKLSPARVPEAITVAASDKYDKLASFSERGKCVDIIAPGVDILSTWNNGKTNSISGTSMATPHVVGVVALALAEKQFENVKSVKDYLKALSSKDRIAGSLRGAPNNLLYNHVNKGEFPDDEPKEPKPQPDEPDVPEEPGECPIPQCFFDPDCTSCCTDCAWGFSKGITV